MKTPEVIKILGSPTDDATTQIHQFDLENGKLIVILSLTSKEPNISRMETIRGVVNFLHHTISGQEFNLQSFKKEIEKNVSSPPFDLIVLYTIDDTIYIFTEGESSVYLIRDGKQNNLLNGKDTVHSVSGKIMDGDLFGVGTGAFWKTVSADTICEYSNKRELVNLDEDFELSVEESPERGLIGGVVLFFGEVRPKEDVVLEEEVHLEPESVPEPVFTPTPNKKHFFVRSREIYEARGINKRTTMAGAVLLLFLGVCLFFGFRAKKSRDEATLVQNTIKNVEQALSQARTISLVNKGRARELIYDARNQIAQISDKETRFPEVKGVASEVSDSLGTVGGIYVDTPDTFSDLSLISANMKADDIQISNDTIRVLGKAENKVATIALPGKRTEMLSGSGSYNNPQKVIAYADRTFVWESGSIKEYGGDSSSVTPPTTADHALIDAFAGNLYILDRDASMIWRYSGGLNGFSEKSAWLTPGVTVDLTHATSMAIDGSIWILTDSGKILKFTQGNQQSVSLQGLDNPLSSSARLFVSDETSDLYILDPAQKSLYVFSKTGDFVAKYENDGLSQTTNMVVSETQRIIVFAAGSKLLSLPIKHLN